ncbi:MAG: von Willebrand factor type A domain-containing protein [Acidobacteriota bacterium]
MSSRSEQRLERLMSVDLPAEPPPGLIDEIVARIPANLPSFELVEAAPVEERFLPLWATRLAAGLGSAALGAMLFWALASSVPKQPQGTEKAWVFEPAVSSPAIDETTVLSDEVLAPEPAMPPKVVIAAPRQPATIRDEITVAEMAPVFDRTSMTAGASFTTNPTYLPGNGLGRVDAPYPDMFFQTWGTNPFVNTADDRLSTFGLDVDTASYGVVRRYLRDGYLPPREAVRVEELVNSLRLDPLRPWREGPRDGDIALAVDGGPSPFLGPGVGAAGVRARLLRITVRARDVVAENRKPAVLTFVVDVSGSMDLENRLGLVKRSLRLLLEQLTAEDRVALVVYGSAGRVVLEHTSDLEAIGEAIDRLESEGSTNAEEGLVLGYRLASEGFVEGAINRVILCSDGVANVGATGPDAILQRISLEAGRGIELSTVGFGMGNYNDTLMEQLADRGDGDYAYVDCLEEARRIFVEELTGTLQTVAEEARIQVEFRPWAVQQYRLLGYENRDIPDESFRDDGVDGGEVGAGQTVTALYEVRLRRRLPGRGLLGTVRLRYRPVGDSEFVEQELPIRRRDLVRRWSQLAPDARLAAITAEFAEILRRSFWARGSSLDDLLLEAEALSPHFAGNQSYDDLVGLIRRAAVLQVEEGEESLFSEAND